LRTASVRRTVAAALVAGVFGTAAGSAQAAPQVDNLTQGTHDKTALVGGGVEMAPVFNQTFDQMPAWTTTPWALPAGCTVPGTAKIEPAGILAVNGARLDSGAGSVGSSLKFNATFADSNQHVGFGVDFNDVARWAMFSTENTGNTVFARTLGGTPAGAKVVPVGALTGAPHDYRIDWNATSVDFWVDGAKVHSEPVTITDPMTAQVSDCTTDTTPVNVDSMSLRTHKSGTYTSKTFDAGDSRVSGITFTPAAAPLPAGTSIAYQTSTSSNGSTWTPFSSGAIQAARYFRYRAVLSTNDVNVTPRLTGATVNFAIDTVAPTTSIAGVAVTGSTARVSFSSNDAGAKYECSLDGGAYKSCSSPAEYRDLKPGSHSVAVRGKDAYGNVGAAASKQFTIAGTQSDKTKPRIALPREADVTRKGKIRMLLECPDTEQFCTVGLKVMWKGKTVASKSKTIDGGDSAYVTPKLSRAAKKKLAKAGKLKVVVKLTVRDAAGNVKKSSKSVWLYPV
jgi:hypothetical protein